MAGTKDKYVYGNVAEKLEQQVQQSTNEYYDPYEQNALLRSKKVARNNAKIKAKIVVYIFLIFGMCAIIMFRYAQISQIGYDSDKIKKDYIAIQQENARIELEIEKAMDLDSIREIAESSLRMHKPDKNQIVYVTVPRQDKTILATKEQSKVLGLVGNVGGSLKKLLNMFY